MKADGIIFDMDGTLYQFDRGQSANFGESTFSRQISANVRRFFVERFGLTPAEAEERYQDIKTRFAGEVSIGLEREHDVPRSNYFAATWDLNPSDFMDQDETLLTVLGDITVRCALLSAAPKVWVDRVMQHLGIAHVFDPHIFTGDPDLRKPDPGAFLQIADAWQLPPGRIVSIGDQEHTDILPAKQAGFMTMLIGPVQSTVADFTATDVPTALKVLKREGIL